MKIKIGTMEEVIERLNNEIYKNVDEGKERLSVELADSERNVSELNTLLSEQFTGSLTFCDDDGVEEVYSGYELESIRKSYDNMGRQIFIEFTRV